MVFWAKPFTLTVSLRTNLTLLVQYFKLPVPVYAHDKVTVNSCSYTKCTIWFLSTIAEFCKPKHILLVSSDQAFINNEDIGALAQLPQLSSDII